MTFSHVQHERMVNDAMYEGKSVKEMAKTMGISEEQVLGHMVRVQDEGGPTKKLKRPVKCFKCGGKIIRLPCHKCMVEERKR